MKINWRKRVRVERDAALIIKANPLESIAPSDQNLNFPGYLAQFLEQGTEELIPHPPSIFLVSYTESNKVSLGSSP
jgi:hypothetical protein